MRDVGNRCFRPGFLVAVAAVDAVLRFDVAAKVCQYLVVVAEDVQVFVVAARLFRRERARGDLDDGFVQFGVVFEVEQRGVAALAQRFDLFDGVAEDEDVVFADGVQDFDVGAVQGADGERAV